MTEATMDVIVAGALQTVVCAYVYMRARERLHKLGLGLLDRLYGSRRRF